MIFGTMQENKYEKSMKQTSENCSMTQSMAEPPESEKNRDTQAVHSKMPSSYIAKVQYNSNA